MHASSRCKSLWAISILIDKIGMFSHNGLRKLTIRARTCLDSVTRRELAYPMAYPSVYVFSSLRMGFKELPHRSQIVT